MAEHSRLDLAPDDAQFPDRPYYRVAYRGTHFVKPSKIDTWRSRNIVVPYRLSNKGVVVGRYVSCLCAFSGAMASSIVRGFCPMHK
jgi:hypothetical protein